jgi:hypothetical protein
MTTQNVKENLNSNEFIKFSFSDFKTFKNKDGEEKKDFTPPQGWSNLTKSSLNQEHNNIGILTGQKSNITVIDYDDKKVFNEDNSKFKFFENNYYIVETKNGYHIYFNYVNLDSALKIGESKKIDLLNDGRFVIAPPTKYYTLDGILITYKLKKGGIIKDMPEDLFNYINDLINKKKGIIKPIEEPKAENTGFGIIQEENKDLKYNISTEEYLPYIDELLDCLSVSRADDRDIWIQIGMLLKKLGCDAGVYHNFSSKSSKYEQKNCDSTWNSLKVGDRINIGTLITYAKTDDPIRLKNIKKMIYEKRNNKKVEKVKKDEKKNDENIDEINEDIIFCSDDDDASTYIFNILKFKLKSYKGRLFYLKDNIWIDDPERVRPELLHYIKKSKIYLKNDKNKLIPYAQQITKAENILKSLINTVIIENDDPDLYDKFHKTTKGRVCFKDGVLDMEEKSENNKNNFHYWNDEAYFNKKPIFSTIMINRNFGDYFYNDKNKDEYIQKLKDDLFLNKYGDDMNVFFHFVSRALNGYSKDKRWASYLGNRNCGKGIEYDLIKNAFGDYVKSFDLGNLLYSRKTEGLESMDCSKKMYWLLDLEFVRLAINQEVPDDSSDLFLNAKIFKKITGGNDDIIAKRNYDRVDTHIKIDTTFYIQGNSELKIKQLDVNEERLEFQSSIQYISKEDMEKFKLTKSENELKKYRIGNSKIGETVLTDDYTNAFIYLIYQSSKSDKVPINRKECDEDENKGLFQCIETYYKITNDKNDFLLIQDVYDRLGENGFTSKKKINNDLQVVNVFKIKATSAHKKGQISYNNKYIFTGIKIKDMNNIVKEEEKTMN